MSFSIYRILYNISRKYMCHVRLSSKNWLRPTFWRSTHISSLNWSHRNMPISFSQYWNEKHESLYISNDFIVTTTLLLINLNKCIHFTTLSLAASSQFCIFAIDQVSNNAILLLVVLFVMNRRRWGISLDRSITVLYIYFCNYRYFNSYGIFISPSCQYRSLIERLVIWLVCAYCLGKSLCLIVGAFDVSSRLFIIRHYFSKNTHLFETEYFTIDFPIIYCVPRW